MSPSASPALEASPPFSCFQNPLRQPMMVFSTSHVPTLVPKNIYYTPGQQFELIWRLTRQVMAVWIGVRVSGGKRSVWLIVELQGIGARKAEEKENDGSARTRSHNRFERLSHSRSLLVLIWHVRQQQHGCRKWGRGRPTDRKQRCSEGLRCLCFQTLQFLDSA